MHLILEAQKGTLMKNYKKNFAILILLCIIITAIPLFFYSRKFWLPLSNVHSNWGEFGSFFGGLISPIVSISTIITMFFIHTNDVKKTKELSFETQQREKIEYLCSCLISFYNTFSDINSIIALCEKSEDRSIMLDLNKKEINKLIIKKDEMYQLYGKCNLLCNIWVSDGNFEDVKGFLHYTITFANLLPKTETEWHFLTATNYEYDEKLKYFKEHFDVLKLSIVSDDIITNLLYSINKTEKLKLKKIYSDVGKEKYISVKLF